MPDRSSAKPPADGWLDADLEQPTMELRAATAPPRAAVPEQAAAPEPAAVPAQAAEVSTPGPVFVDTSGRRGRSLRLLGWLIGVVCVGFAAVLVGTVMSARSGAPALDIPDPAQSSASGAPQSPEASATTGARPGSTASTAPAASPLGGTGSGQGTGTPRPTRRSTVGTTTRTATAGTAGSATTSSTRPPAASPTASAPATASPSGIPADPTAAASGAGHSPAPRSSVPYIPTLP